MASAALICLGVLFYLGIVVLTVALCRAGRDDRE